MSRSGVWHGGGGGEARRGVWDTKLQREPSVISPDGPFVFFLPRRSGRSRTGRGVAVFARDLRYAAAAGEEEGGSVTRVAADRRRSEKKGGGVTRG